MTEQEKHAVFLMAGLCVATGRYLEEKGEDDVDNAAAMNRALSAADQILPAIREDLRMGFLLALVRGPEKEGASTREAVEPENRAGGSEEA